MNGGLSFDERQQLLRSARVSGRRITVIGGGTGLSTLLLGLKEYTDNITAIVTVTDDGGGSGMLRREFGMLPPGDIRNCLLSLANTSTMMSRILNYRFDSGSLAGQNFGNLFLLALNEICGSFDAAVASMNRILAVTGQVLPVTNSNIVLRAVFDDGSSVCGETAITQEKQSRDVQIEHVELLPASAEALPSVIEAIHEADLIVLGPGSLYTSVIPNLLVGGVAEALRASNALRLYVLNIMTQEGETEGYSALRHVREINKHAGGGVVDVCLYNSQPVPQKLLEKYRGENSEQLFPDRELFAADGVRLFGGDMLARSGGLVRHDPLRLAYNIMLVAESLRPRQGAAGESDRLLLKQE